MSAPVIAVVPARGGSKGVPRKNLRSVNGQSLLSRAVRAALDAPAVNDVLISTDDDEVAARGHEAGAEWIVRRPPALATDDTAMIDVLVHALAEIRERYGEPEALVLLQPTSPFRTAEHVQAACDVFRRTGADCVVTVQPVPHHFSPSSLFWWEQGRLQPVFDGWPAAARRQDKPRMYARNGPAVLVVRPSVIDQGRLYGDHTAPLEMSPLESLDIDCEDDLAVAEALCRAGLLDGGI